MGYDGKGQVMIDRHTAVEDAWARMGTGALECFIDMKLEISIVLARGLNGEIKTYPPVEHPHKNHILHTTTYPANIGRDPRSGRSPPAPSRKPWTTLVSWPSRCLSRMVANC